MKRIPKIYLETTIFNYFLDTERGDSHKATVELFNAIRKGRFYAFTSQYVINELKKASEPKRMKMIKLISEYNIAILEPCDESAMLADKYIEAHIIPEKFKYDAFHVAITATNELDIILSFNFKHINKLSVKELTAYINTREGYFKQVRICTPMEVIEE